eukprot:690871-Alexandrium_andersonii.AAC.1
MGLLARTEIERLVAQGMWAQQACAGIERERVGERESERGVRERERGRMRTKVREREREIDRERE